MKKFDDKAKKPNALDKVKNIYSASGRILTWQIHSTSRRDHDRDFRHAA
jgi:hypothetical protein